MTVSAIAPSEKMRGAKEAPRPPRVLPKQPAGLDPPAPRPPRGSPRESSAGGAEGAFALTPRVVIADHQAASRSGIRLALEGAGFIVIAEADTGEDAAAFASTLSPDACLVDVDIPGGGIATARAISSRVPGTAVVMLSVAPNEEDLLAAIVAGASGYLLKTMDPERVPVAVRGVLAGEVAIPRSLGKRLLEEIRRRGDGAAPPYVRGRQILLTPRELQVMQLIRKDMPTREIAARLGISEVTVRRHVSTALRKLEVPDRQAAVRLLERSRPTSAGRFVP
jgi:DNA-binding NarL/FixJ family response regulator